MYAKQLRIRILQIISGCESSPLHQPLDSPSGQCDPKPAITGLALITITHDEMDIINLLGCLRMKLSFPFIHINRDMRTVHPPQEIPQVDTDDIIKPLQRVMTQKFQLLIQYGNTAAVHDNRLPQSTMTGLQLRHTATAHALQAAIFLRSQNHILPFPIPPALRASPV